MVVHQLRDVYARDAPVGAQDDDTVAHDRHVTPLRHRRWRRTGTIVLPQRSLASLSIWLTLPQARTCWCLQWPYASRWMMQVALTEWVVFALQKRRFLAPNDPHVGADWIRRFDVVVAYADALATSAIAEKVIPVLLAPICCANRRSARRHSHGSAGVSARCSTWSKSLAGLG